MKQNNLVSDFDSKEMFKEIDSISKLLLIKYSDEFDEKSAFKMANTLYNNGVRSYMFFEEKYDIDEIVFFLKSRENVIKFNSRVYNYSFMNDDVNNSDAKIVNIDRYLNRRKNNRK